MASANFYLESQFAGSTPHFGSPEDVLADPRVREALTREFINSTPELRKALEEAGLLNGVSREELSEPHFVYNFKKIPQEGARYQVEVYDLFNE